MDKSKITKSLAVFASVLLIIIIGVASFAYFGTFNVNLNNNVAVNINSSSPGNATFTSNATQLNLQVPAANMSQTASNNEVAAASNTATLTVNLTGAANLLTTCTYDIVYEYDSTSNVYGKSPTTKNGNKEITLQVSNVNGTNNFANEKNFDYDSSWSGLKRTLVSGATISSNGTLTAQNISIIGKYYNLTIPQTSIEGKVFTGKIYVTNHSCSTSELPGYYTILANNGGEDAIIAKGSPDFSTISTTNEGLYAAEDDLGTSYYYRGAVDNNWIKFGKYTKDMYNCNKGTISNIDTGNSCTKIASSGDDIYWRIIRINGDNSIRMIYSGVTPPTESTKVIKTTDTSLGGIPFNQNDNGAEYLGYMYEIGKQHGISKSSDIKTFLDNWYANYTDLNKTGTKITDQIYCNDRTASIQDVAYSTTNYTTLTSWISTGAYYYYYGAYGRIVKDNNPILTCAVDSDRFTVNKINGKGNSALDYPVGLITADEVAMAGGVDNTENSSYYLYTPQDYWLGSPTYSRSGTCESATYSGQVRYEFNLSSEFGARPVISLSSDTKLLGSGTYNDVYTVS
mgnify:CR=1 FL=1